MSIAVSERLKGYFKKVCYPILQDVALQRLMFDVVGSEAETWKEGCSVGELHCA